MKDLEIGKLEFTSTGDFLIKRFDKGNYESAKVAELEKVKVEIKINGEKQKEVVGIRNKYW